MAGWESGADRRMQEWRDEGSRTLARQPKTPQGGPSMPSPRWRIVLYRIAVEITQDGASLTEAGAERLADAVADATDGGEVGAKVLEALYAAGLPKELDECITIRAEVV